MDGPASRAWRARPSHAWAARPRAGAPGDGGAAGELYRVPAHAAWFRYNAVNPIERSELPDFFSGKHAARGPAVCAPAPTPPPPRARPGAQAAWPAPAPALWRCARSERPWGPWAA